MEDENAVYYGMNEYDARSNERARRINLLSLCTVLYCTRYLYFIFFYDRKVLKRPPLCTYCTRLQPHQIADVRRYLRIGRVDEQMTHDRALIDSRAAAAADA